MQTQRSRRASRVARPIHGSSLAQRCAGSSSAPQRGCTDSARGCTGNAWLTAAGGSAARPRVRLPPSPTRRGATGRLSIADGCRASYGYGGEPGARARQTPPSTLAAHLSVGVFPAARRSRWLSRCTRTAQSATQRRRRSRAAQATPALSVAARSEPRRDPAAAPAANSQKSRVECRGLVVLTNVTRARSAAAASPSDGPAPFPTRATLDARQPASLWPDRLRHAGGVARGAHAPRPQGRSRRGLPCATRHTGPDPRTGALLPDEATARRPGLKAAEPACDPTRGIGCHSQSPPASRASRAPFHVKRATHLAAGACGQSLARGFT